MNTTMKNRALRAAIAGLCACLMLAALLTGFAPAAHAEYKAPDVIVELWKQNKDVIGGIYIPGTTVCYPILQHPTVDDYYLNICFDGTEGYPGSIYTNKVEGQSFSTFNTVIYGHNMRDGSYFGSLKLFLDPDYLMEHREIDIYGVNAMHVYDIFAVVIYNDKRITDYYPDDTLGSRRDFLQSLQSDGLDGTILLTDKPVDPLYGHIITLSTCISDMHDNRLLIVAVEREE